MVHADGGKDKGGKCPFFVAWHSWLWRRQWRLALCLLLLLLLLRERRV
jgi:hypothetical protein